MSVARLAAASAVVQAGIAVVVTEVVGSPCELGVEMELKSLCEQVEAMEVVASPCAQAVGTVTENPCEMEVVINLCGNLCDRKERTTVDIESLCVVEAKVDPKAVVI